MVSYTGDAYAVASIAIMRNTRFMRGFFGVEGEEDE